MKLVYRLLLISCWPFLVQAQVGVFVSDSSGSIYSLDLRDCTTTFVVDIANELKPNDITFHPNGNLYGISSGGEIYEINLITGETTNIVQLSFDQVFNSLTCDENGLFYATGDEGVLWTYDIDTDKDSNLGSFGYDASGDLIFFYGSLYVATRFDRIIRINLSNLSNSSVVINQNVAGVIYGLVSFSENCKSFDAFAHSSNGDVYFLNFINNSLEFNCEINLEVYGGASTYDFIISAEPIAISFVNVFSPTCKDSGEIEVFTSGGTPPFEFAINDGEFQVSNVFSNLSEGIYDITVIDAYGCQVVATDISILGINCQVFIPDAFSPNNDGVNDEFGVITLDGIDVTITTFNVYNRWGLLVYQGNNRSINSTQASWDGTYENIEQEIGVYLYYIELNYSDGSNEELKGNVTLVR